jgi:hypothetical protein
MRNFCLTAAAVAALTFANSAEAAVIINSTDAVGTSYVVEFTGQVNGSTAPQLSSVLTLAFNGVSNGGSTFNFAYSLLNDSSVSANLRSFGFDLSGGSMTNASATGVFGTVGLNSNFPEGAGFLDVCFHTTGPGNCTGGKGGLASGQTGAGTLALSFSGTPGSIALDNITTRYQSISPSLNGGNSGIGIRTPVTGAVPEPGTWALMILGFCAVGFVLRRKNMETRVAFA